MSTGRAIGAVREIHRHPVKSMGGESIRETLIEKRFGVVGDRAWAIRDLSAGEIRGAKKIPALMMLGARYLEDPKDGASAPIEIDLGDGRRVRSGDPSVSERISEQLGRPVQLCSRPPAHDKAHYRRARPITDPDAEMREAYELLPDEPTPKLMEGPVDLSLVTEYVSPPGTYFDFFHLHLLTLQSLARLQSLLPDSQVDPRRFRPNLVIDWAGSEQPFPEFAWPGRCLAIGELRLQVIMPAMRCGMITHAQADLRKDPSIMRAVVRECDMNFGVGAQVLTPGCVRVGDRVRLLEPGSD